VTAQIPSPLAYHRTRRDHQLRMFFSAAQRNQNGKPLWSRNQGSGRRELLAILTDALYHAQEVVRERPLEWPDSRADDADKALLGFLDEIQAWFRLLETVTAGGEDPRGGLSALLEGRIRYGLRLFHTGRLTALGTARTAI
jgi:hypothetical protein